MIPVVFGEYKGHDSSEARQGHLVVEDRQLDHVRILRLVFAVLQQDGQQEHRISTVLSSQSRVTNDLNIWGKKAKIRAWKITKILDLYVLEWWPRIDCCWSWSSPWKDCHLHFPLALEDSENFNICFIWKMVCFKILWRIPWLRRGDT